MRQADTVNEASRYRWGKSIQYMRPADTGGEASRYSMRPMYFRGCGLIRRLWWVFTHTNLFTNYRTSGIAKCRLIFMQVGFFCRSRSANMRTIEMFFILCYWSHVLSMDRWSCQRNDIRMKILKRSVSAHFVRCYLRMFHKKWKFGNMQLM